MPIPPEEGTCVAGPCCQRSNQERADHDDAVNVAVKVSSFVGGGVHQHSVNGLMATFDFLSKVVG